MLLTDAEWQLFGDVCRHVFPRLLPIVPNRGVVELRPFTQVGQAVTVRVFISVTRRAKVLDCCIEEGPVADDSLVPKVEKSIAQKKLIGFLVQYRACFIPTYLL